MPSEFVTPNKDDDFGEEITSVVFKMITEVRDMYQKWQLTPEIVYMSFKNEFIPDFVSLYDLTSDKLYMNHNSDEKTDKDIKDEIAGLLYYLDGVTGNNNHTIRVNQDTILEGIRRFREYKRQLVKENILKVI